MTTQNALAVYAPGFGEFLQALGNVTTGLVEVREPYITTEATEMAKKRALADQFAREVLALAALGYDKARLERHSVSAGGAELGTYSVFLAPCESPVSRGIRTVSVDGAPYAISGHIFDPKELPYRNDSNGNNSNEWRLGARLEYGEVWDSVYPIGLVMKRQDKLDMIPFP